MNKMILLAAVMVACGDSEPAKLNTDLVDCSTTTGGMYQRCNLGCEMGKGQILTIPMPIQSRKCSIATNGNEVDACATGYAGWVTANDGDSHFGCCLDTTFSARGQVPAGELHFYECDRSEWPAQKP